MEDESVGEGSAPVFEIRFVEKAAEWILFKQEPFVPFDLRFKDPEPGKWGAVSYAQFVGRKTGGLIRVLESGKPPQTLCFTVEQL